MPAEQEIPHAIGDSHQLSPRERQERKERLLTQGTPSITSGIAEAVVIKDQNVFFLADPQGRVPLEQDHGLGLYYHDCRFLNGYEMRVAGAEPNTLVSTAARGFKAVFQLTNPDIRMENGNLIPKERVGIKWERTIDSAGLALHEAITFQSFERERIEFPISLTFNAEFEDIFVVRGLLPEKKGKSQPPRWQDGILSFRYEGADGLHRSLSIYFSPRPRSVDGTTARCDVGLEPGESRQVRISLVMAESPERGDSQPKRRAQPDLKRVEASEQRSAARWLGKPTRVVSNSLLLNSIIDRSLRDLHLLRSSIDDHEFLAAGVPWFTTLFGRDSLITALQTLAYDPDLAEQTLRLLAGYQGRQANRWKDEQPGKILHELRIGELARLGRIPYTPYYGTVDATPLFLLLIGRHATWTGDLDLFRELKDNVELALEWISRYGDLNGDGYVEYESTSEEGLINQGWKDSGDAIVNADGSLANPPIGLVEVQGYVYLAKLNVADLYERSGDRDRAAQLRREAEELHHRFNRDFWLEDREVYALALQAGNKPAAVVSSNPGHALWTGIAEPERARRTAERLMSEEMFGGWGIRTLSQQERAYNPIGYHLGTVWPHDNALIAAGFRRYGFDEDALRIFTGIVEAAMHFQDYRLPEVFAGFSRAEYPVPVHFPVACHPQAWAAGSVPHLVETLLGLVPEAFDRRLRIVQPVLPDFVDRLELHRLRVGNAHVDLSFHKTAGGVGVQVLKVDGDLDVVIQSQDRVPLT